MITYNGKGYEGQEYDYNRINLLLFETLSFTSSSLDIVDTL